jgi:DNA invertase Pin-like site-specific DNA recombinase
LFPEPSVSVIAERERHQIVERFASRLETAGNAGGWRLS